jgi:hypothetical protein
MSWEEMSRAKIKCTCGNEGWEHLETDDWGRARTSFTGAFHEEHVGYYKGIEETRTVCSKCHKECRAEWDRMGDR